VKGERETGSPEGMQPPETANLFAWAVSYWWFMLSVIVVMLETAGAEQSVVADG
jgi:hypothetical protein